MYLVTPAYLTACTWSHLPTSAYLLLLLQLLLKKEVGPHLRLLLAAMGGSMEHIARRVNPFAGMPGRQ